MDKSYAEYLINQTKEGYNALALDYTRTRAFIPEDIKEMASYVSIGDRVLDAGCASGRLYAILKEKNVEYFGIDTSENLIDIAKGIYFHPSENSEKKISQARANFQVADGSKLPFPDNYFDKVFSISVLHHIPSKEIRTQHFREMNRVLKPKGLLVFRVWDFWRRKRTIGLIAKFTFLKLTGKSKLDFNDVFLPWKDSEGNPVVQRYFHCFTKGELKKLAAKTGFKIKKIWRAGKDPRTNIYLVAEK